MRNAPDANDFETAGAARPLTLAAIDAGSNALRLLVAEFDDATHSRIVAQERLPVRLGHNVFLSGALAEDAMDRAVEGFATFRRQMDALDVARYRAVATSAVRESTNGEAFIERVRRETGIEVEVITGSEEARLAFRAVQARLPLGSERWAMMDIGGGSVEVMLVDRSGLLWSESHTIGTVRLLEELRLAGEAPGRLQRLVTEYMATLRIASAADRWGVAGFVATGGNVEALAKLAGLEPDASGVSRLPLATLRELAQALARLSFSERVRQLSLREDRADVILPAAFITLRIAEVVGADTVVVPHVGLKEGILFDLAEDVILHRFHEDERDRAVLAGAIALGQRYRFDEEHGVHVGRLALSLFDQLRALHGLDDQDRRVLLAAAVLHDLGLFVSHKRHHKHSLYLLQNSEIAGFTPGEMLMIANVARYHRKGGPSAEHEQFARLGADERERVRSLSAILRLADALDREHRQHVSDVRAEATDTGLVLHVDGGGDMLLERWALEKKADLFEELFGLRVSLASVA
ncbi:MAG TPA: Ppx/GppA phosphatase family protein [Longimicrobiales bacterium]|nr:Ppx/GppA phosphatase family protein [Longimicrobiales bacterium]